MQLRSKKIFIAQMLLEKKLISPEQLNTALEIQKTSDKKMGQILVDLGFIEEDTVLKILANQLHIEFINLKNFKIDEGLFDILSEFHARQFRAIVLRKEQEGYLVGMVDPQNLIAIDEIERLIHSKIIVALVKEADLLSIFDFHYKRSEEIMHFAESLSEDLTGETEFAASNEKLSSQDLPVVNLLRSIFEQATQSNASDIHIEPDEHVLRLRLRIDGLLHEQIIDDQKISQALIQRIKLMSNLNIAEKRLPQDGRFSITVNKHKLDIRVSTVPVQYGESLVMRLLNQSDAALTLDQLGMPDDVHEAFQRVLHASYGLILIVGPTGSGKTTTLYSSLTLLNNADTKIITVEDPVEYRISRINQIQVNSEIDLTFANVLRAILRQDPDVVMIGEMRDKTTLEIAIRAAMTGHLVFATLHTNDTPSTITRLIDMGAEGYLIASVLRSVLAQRLVRKICKFCTQDALLTPQQEVWLKSVTSAAWESVQFKTGKGCVKCHHTGFRGRIGVYEFLMITPQLTDALRMNDIKLFNDLIKKDKSFQTLLDRGLSIAFAGMTSIEEVISMTGEI